MNVVAFVPDLIDRSKVAGAAPGTTFVAEPEELPSASAGADLVVVDLSRPGVLDAVRTIHVRTIGFARHTSPELLAAARAAGCAEALTRSQFFGHLADWLVDRVGPDR